MCIPARFAILPWRIVYSSSVLPLRDAKTCIPARFAILPWRNVYSSSVLLSRNAKTCIPVQFDHSSREKSVFRSDLTIPAEKKVYSGRVLPLRDDKTCIPGWKWGFFLIILWFFRRATIGLHV